MADLLSLSARYIDENIYEGPQSVNRISSALSEIGDRLALIEAFAHMVCIETDDGLLLFDTSLPLYTPNNLRALRRWSDAPVHSVVFTHGHFDHVGGMDLVLEEAQARRDRRPRIIAQENIHARFDRYDMTNGFNYLINLRQFSPSGAAKMALASDDTPMPRFGPAHWVRPDLTFSDRLHISIGGLSVHLRHGKGETDDHLWAWIPEKQAICCGDFLIWAFPNAGNPQKVQRYPLEWAKALREMAALEPELLIPTHGLPIGGAIRIQEVLHTTAGALESLVQQCLDLMNAGAGLDDLINTVRLPADILERPYLRPVYDEPEFIVHNVWRLYGGWYDGNPAHLKPAPQAALAGEVAALAGGVAALIARATALSTAGDHRLACHLIEMATQAEPTNAAAHEARAAIYQARRKDELSLMAKGIYKAAAEDSLAKLGKMPS